MPRGAPLRGAPRKAGGTPIATIDEERWVAETAAGARCKNRRLTGTDLCVQHAKRATGEVVARRGARGVGRLLRDADLTRGVPAALAHAMMRAAVDVHQRRISPNQGASIAALLRGAVDAAV